MINSVLHNSILPQLNTLQSTGEGKWIALCPAHDDHNPSLSISESDNGQVLLHCFAGCTTESIVSSLGIRMSDLMGNSTVSSVNVSITPAKVYKKQGFGDSNSTSGKIYDNYQDAISIYESKLGKCSNVYQYVNKDGELQGVVLRWDLPDGGKVIRQLSHKSSGWVKRAMADPRPLYKLPELEDAKRVYVCEGEKCVDAILELGLTATTSSGGCKCAAKTDWSPLAGKEVILVPDNDDSGDKYVDDVSDILSCLNPVPVIKYLNLPDLDNGEDVYDYIQRQISKGMSNNDIRDEIDKLAGNLPIIETDDNDNSPLLLLFKEFPLDTLPEPIRAYVEQGAKAIGCDPCYLILPLLSALGAAIGNTRLIELKETWQEHAIIWTVIIGESGNKKSPALDMALLPVIKRQCDAFKKYEDDYKQYIKDKQKYDCLFKDWNKNLDKSDLPEEPQEPVPDRYLTDDCTIEAITDLLSKQRRGLLLRRDEMGGWFTSFDRYSKSKGGDVNKWNEMFGGRLSIVDRKTAKSIYISQSSVSICGGIQPDVLRRILTKEYWENGLAPRILMAMPPSKLIQWSDDVIEPAVEQKLVDVFDDLYNLDMTLDDKGDVVPVILRLTPEAKKIFIKFYNDHNKEQVKYTGDIGATWSKLEGYVPRIALVIHMVRCAAQDATIESDNKVDSNSIRAAIDIVQWFGHEAKRIHSIFEQDTKEQADNELILWILHRGGNVSVRELTHGLRRFKNKTLEAVAALNKLSEQGYGNWKYPDRNNEGGRPTKRFYLTKGDIHNN